mgnify:CR=1 FL=1
MKQVRSPRMRYALEGHEHDGAIKYPENPEGKFWSNQGWVDIPTGEFDDDEFFRRGQTTMDPLFGIKYLRVYGSQAASSSGPKEKKTVDSAAWQKISYKMYYTRVYRGQYYAGGWNDTNSGFPTKDGFAWRIVYGVTGLDTMLYMRHRFWDGNSSWDNTAAYGVELAADPQASGGEWKVNLMRDGAVYETIDTGFSYVDEMVYAQEIWGAGGEWGGRIVELPTGRSATWSTVSAPTLVRARNSTEFHVDNDGQLKVYLSHAQLVNYFGKRLSS